LILFAKSKGLSGLEFLAGIPGTVGGSLIGNAGAWGKAIGSLVKQVCVLDYQGHLRLLSKRQLRFSYRKSNLNKYIIIWARLKLQKKDNNIIAAEIKRYLLARSKSLNNTLPNAGCIFKNPAGPLTSGKLIDLCALKGKMKGKAIISKKHANFILNLGNAKSSDVIFLIDLMRRKVKSNFGINLPLEIKLWK
jgi:UDP-N-acetylmuramate dehydrogenase